MTVSVSYVIDVLRGRKAAQAFPEDMADRQEEERATRALLNGLVIIPVTQEMAEVAGRFKRRTKARHLELADCLIAAAVFVEGAALATGNMKDYPMPKITVIKAR